MAKQISVFKKTQISSRYCYGGYPTSRIFVRNAFPQTRDIDFSNDTNQPVGKERMIKPLCVLGLNQENANFLHFVLWRVLNFTDQL
jgi:hypothetical protein